MSAGFLFYGLDEVLAELVDVSKDLISWRNGLVQKPASSRMGFVIGDHLYAFTAGWPTIQKPVELFSFEYVGRLDMKCLQRRKCVEDNLLPVS